MYVLLASCLLALHVVQLHAGNVQPNTEPLTVEIEGPQAGMLGQTVTFSASPSGGSEEYTSYQWNIDGQDKGTGASLDYTVPAGDGDAKEVTVKCTVTDSEGESEPGEIQFWQVKITLKRDGSEITGTPEVWAGERITLAAEFLPADLGTVLHNWAIPPSPIADYVMSQNEGRVIGLTDAQLHSANVTFYWVDGDAWGTSKTVEYEPTIKNATVKVSQTFLVRRPEARYRLDPLGSVACDTDWHALLPGFIALHLGNLHPPGFSVTLQNYLPSGFSYAWVQTVGGYRIWLSPTLSWNWDVNTGLDFIISSLVINDSPSLQVPWPSWEMEASDNMDTTFLCRPPGNDSIYIPLHFVLWGWYGNASRSAFSWRLDSQNTYRSATMMTRMYHPCW